MVALTAGLLAEDEMRMLAADDNAARWRPRDGRLLPHEPEALLVTGGAGIRIPPTALVADGASIGQHTRTWAFGDALAGAVNGAPGQGSARVF